VISRKLTTRLEKLEIRMIPEGEPLILQIQFVSFDGVAEDGPRFHVPGAGRNRLEASQGVFVATDNTEYRAHSDDVSPTSDWGDDFARSKEKNTRGEHVFPSTCPLPALANGHFPVTAFFAQNGVFTTKEKLGLVPDVELHARRSCHEDFL
jgi:hypothetical protein